MTSSGSMTSSRTVRTLERTSIVESAVMSR